MRKRKTIVLGCALALVAGLTMGGCAVPFEGTEAVSPNSIPQVPAAEQSAEAQEEVLPMDAENKIWNVKDFGAKGNGRSDDYTALQRAVNTVIRAGGGTIFVPAGTYSISQTLRITMEGDAPLTLVANPSEGINYLKWQNTDKAD